jgi:hypothetical protein
LAQHLFLVGYVVEETLHPIFPGVLRVMVNDYLQRDSKEQSTLHESILAKNTSRLMKLQAQRTPLAQANTLSSLKSSWQMSRSLSQGLVDKISAGKSPSCTISRIRSAIKDCLVFHRNKLAGGFLETLLQHILLETSLI